MITYNDLKTRHESQIAHLEGVKRTIAAKPIRGAVPTFGSITAEYKAQRLADLDAAIHEHREMIADLAAECGGDWTMAV